MSEAHDTRSPKALSEAPLVLMLSAAHPPTDLRIVGKEGATLAAAGWRVTHLAPAPLRGAKDVPASHAGVTIATYPRSSGWMGRLRGARALARRAARLKPDVIHAHEPDSWYAAILAARKTGAAVVLDVHEHYPSRLDNRLPGLFRGLGRRAVLASCRWMAARADAIVVAKDGLEDAFPGNAVVPVRNYAASVPVAPREHRQGPVTLVHLGALTRERGAFEMLQALAQSPEGTRLSLIGRFTDSSETEFLSEAKRLGLAGAVERHGWLPHDAAVARAAEADIGLVLFQPGHENHRLALPHKLFDCMLAGLPVIAPDFAEEVAAVVRETGCGILVDTADPGTIANAVRSLRDPKRRAEMGAAGRAAALGRYGWGGEADRLIALYRDLAPLPQSSAMRPMASHGKPAEAGPAQPAIPLTAALNRAKPTAPAAPQPPLPPFAEIARAPVTRASPEPADTLFANLSAAIRAASPPAPASSDAVPRLPEAALGEARALPAAPVSSLAHQAPAAAPEPRPAASLPGHSPPSPQALGSMAPETSRVAVPPASPAAALSAMVRAIREAAPEPQPGQPAEPAPALLASLHDAPGATPPALPRPAAPAAPALTGRPIGSAPRFAGMRLLTEAGLTAARSVPSPLAALLARTPDAASKPLPARSPVNSDVPLVEAGLRAANPRMAPQPVPSEWRLLQPSPALPPLPDTAGLPSQARH
jgi:glycosyltransferase involved in cell wall biosynthesis